MGDDDWRGTCMTPSKALTGWDQDAIEYPMRPKPFTNWSISRRFRARRGKIYQRPFGGMTTNFGEGIAQRTCARRRTGLFTLHTLYGQLVTDTEFFIEYFALI